MEGVVKKLTATIRGDKKNEKYTEVISILTAVRGVRGRQRKADSISSFEFSLVKPLVEQLRSKEDGLLIA